MFWNNNWICRGRGVDVPRIDEEGKGFDRDISEEGLSEKMEFWCKAPEDVNLENDGESELDFLEYRKQLRSVLSTIGTLMKAPSVSTMESIRISYRKQQSRPVFMRKESFKDHFEEREEDQ
ncbi:hypothetical protein Tcan_18346 [Toxocara canis]|uniref:Uncharacterized protein n=1 Tax=Toxocara canis TaxID=6265 RepID=A0A0B2V1M9_TOXCA|nr:hypothetical protein Tcan_18346 [Toxocara canis]